MKLIVGLGNPDQEYLATRHNFGWQVLNVLAEKKHLTWKKAPDKNSQIAEYPWGREKIILCQPLNYMNKSGEAILALTQFYKITPDNIIVIYDDLDLNFGTIRLSQNRSSGGHKGLESIIKNLKSQDFIRLRLGIGPQTGKAEDFVLNKFTATENRKLPEIIDTSHLILEILLNKGFDQAANQYN